MPSRWLTLLAFATISLLIGCSGPTVAPRKPPLDAARLKQALVGIWVIDQEATADSMARSAFGPQQSVTISKTGDQPVTIRTNFTNKPFNQQEYEKAKRICLESLRANDGQTWMTFASDGTGTASSLTESGSRSAGDPFHWVLQGRKLTVEFPHKRSGADFQTEFTDTNQLCCPIHFLRACMFFKPERSAPKPLTNAPAQ